MAKLRQIPLDTGILTREKCKESHYPENHPSTVYSTPLSSFPIMSSPFLPSTLYSSTQHFFYVWAPVFPYRAPWISKSKVSSKCSSKFYGPLLLQVQSMGDQQCHHSEACWICRISAPTPDLWNQVDILTGFPGYSYHIKVWDVLAAH